MSGTVKLHQTIAPGREQAYRESETARRALVKAKHEGASAERLRRLQQAYFDAGQLHGDWKRADSLAAQAGAFEHLECHPAYNNWEY